MPSKKAAPAYRPIGLDATTSRPIGLDATASRPIGLYARHRVGHIVQLD